MEKSCSLHSCYDKIINNIHSLLCSTLTRYLPPLKWQDRRSFDKVRKLGDGFCGHKVTRGKYRENKAPGSLFWYTSFIWPELKVMYIINVLRYFAYKPTFEPCLLVIYKKNRCDYIRVTQYNTSMLLTLFTYVSALQYKTKTTNKDLKRI